LYLCCGDTPIEGCCPLPGFKERESNCTGTKGERKVGTRFDARDLHTERSVNYKLRATWLTPEVIRARCRMEQMASGLSDQETERMVSQREGAGDTVLLVELDPHEGFGSDPRHVVRNPDAACSVRRVHPKFARRQHTVSRQLPGAFRGSPPRL
jgi:hypothetical protein